MCRFSIPFVEWIVYWNHATAKQKETEAAIQGLCPSCFQWYWERFARTATSTTKASTGSRESENANGLPTTWERTKIAEPVAPSWCFGTSLDSSLHCIPSRCCIGPIPLTGKCLRDFGVAVASTNKDSTIVAWQASLWKHAVFSQGIWLLSQFTMARLSSAWWIILFLGFDVQVSFASFCSYFWCSHGGRDHATATYCHSCARGSLIAPA